MNHSSPGSLALNKTIIGFLNYKTAEGLTDRSVNSYKRYSKSGWNPQGKLRWVASRNKPCTGVGRFFCTGNQ